MLTACAQDRSFVPWEQLERLRLSQQPRMWVGVRDGLWAAPEAGDLPPQDKLDGFVPAHFLGWYLKVRRPRQGDTWACLVLRAHFPDAH